MNVMLKKICCLMLAALMVITSQTFAVYAEEYDEEVVEESIEDIETDVEEEEEEQKETEPTFTQDNAPVYFDDNKIAGELFLNPVDIDEQSSFEYVLMMNCGFFEKGVAPQNKVTRGEMCKILYAMLMGDVNYTYSDISLFSDVGKDHKMMPYIEALGVMGIIGGNGSGMFYPDYSVTLEEAVKMLVLTLNYNAVAVEKGGYPAGYMKVAQECGILYEIDSAAEVVTYDMLAKLLYNMLDVVLSNNPYESNKVYYLYGKAKPGTNPSAFSDMVNLYSGHGIVEGNEKNSTGTIANADSIRINGENYRMDGDDYTDIIGMEVWYFYSVDHSTGRKNMIMMMPYTSRFEVIAIESDEIVDVDTSSIVYMLHENEREHRVALSQAIAFYNGKLYHGADIATKIEELMQKSCGHLKVVTDGINTAVHIWDYEVYQVTAIDESAQIIYANNLDGVASKLCLKDYEEYQILQNGNKIDLSGMKKDRIMMVAATPEYDYLQIECLNDKYTINGSIEKITTGKTVCYTIQGMELKANPRFLMKNEHKMKFNTGVKFYLDKYGKIVFHQFTGSDSYQYGYLIDAAEEGNFTKTVALRMLNETGELQTYQVSDKVQVTYPTNVYATDSYEYSLKAGESLLKLSGLVSENGQITPQLVKFQLNEEGKIKILKLAKNDFLFQTVPVRDYDSMSNILSEPLSTEDVFIADYEVESIPVGNTIHVTNRSYGKYPFGVTANHERSYNEDDFVRCYTNFDVAKYVEGDGTFSFYKLHENRGLVKYTGGDNSGDFSDSYTNLPGYLVRLVSSDNVTGIVFSLDSRYMITNDTKVFVVPAKADASGFISLDGQAADEAYSIADLRAWPSKRYAQVQLFDIDENNFVKAMLLVDRNSLPMSLESTDATGVLPTNCVVAAPPENILMDGVHHTKVTVYEKGVLKELIMPVNSDYTDDGMAMRHFDSDGEFAGLYGFKYSFNGTEKKAEFEQDIHGLYQGTAFADLQVGDIIKYRLDGTGKVKNFTVVFNHKKASAYGYYEDSLAATNNFGNITSMVNSKLGNAISLKNGSMTYVSSAEVYVYGKVNAQRELTASYNSLTMDTRLLSLTLYPRFTASANVERQYVVYQDDYSTIASIPIQRSLTVSDSVYCYRLNQKDDSLTKILFTDILPEDEVFWAQADSKGNGLLLVVRD